MKQTDKQFMDLMKSYPGEKAPGDFSIHVMDRIYAQSNRVSEYKPVINKWFLRAVYALFAVFVLYAVFGSGSSGGDHGNVVPEQLENYFPQVDLSGATDVSEKVAGALGSLPQSLIILFLGATLLLLLDQWYLKRKSFSSEGN